eukprot:TRINITY_DN7070_c0_g1_i1.p1 TRINITY_DN7070_c0_g1~~TRINITY_DN7070_c0_g1_i1.p1  ORF type:complete len:446 (-),score=56.97 TRINITY_DN7070_c0_g1_i1:393-1730(-)
MAAGGGYPSSNSDRSTSAPSSRRKRTPRPPKKHHGNAEEAMLARAMLGDTDQQKKKRDYIRLPIRRFEDNQLLFEVTISPKASTRQLHGYILDRLAGEDGKFEQPVKLLCNKVQLYIDDRMLDQIGVDHKTTLHIARTRRRCIFLSNSTDGSVKIWSGRSFRCLSTLLHSTCVNTAQLSPDGALVATTCLDGVCRIWCAANGDLISMLRGHKGTMTFASICPDSSFAATASEDCTVKLWHIDKEKCLGTLTGHQSPVTMVHFSPDGSLLATASQDRTACVWERQNGSGGEARCLAPLVGHTDKINTVGWSASGVLVVTTSADRTARIWDARSGRCRQVFGGLGVWLCQAEFAEKDQIVFTCSPNGVIRLWAVGAVGTNECLRVYRMGCAVISAYLQSSKLYVVLQEERKEGYFLRVYCPDDDEPPLTFHGHTGRILGAKMASIRD